MYLLLPVEQWPWLGVFCGHVARFCSLPPGDPEEQGRPLRDYLFLSPSPACRGPHVLSTFLWPPQGLNAMKAADPALAPPKLLEENAQF